MPNCSRMTLLLCFFSGSMDEKVVAPSSFSSKSRGGYQIPRKADRLQLSDSFLTQPSLPLALTLRQHPVGTRLLPRSAKHLAFRSSSQPLIANTVNASSRNESRA